MRKGDLGVLSGDGRKYASDMYNHIDLKELKEAYVRHS
jgi:hypothetical protein